MLELDIQYKRPEMQGRGIKSFWLKLFCNFSECRQLGSSPLRTTGTHKHKKQEDYSTDLDGHRDTPHGLQF